MTTLSTATFQQANQSGWNPASDNESWSVLVGSPTLNISSNEGTCTTGSFADSVTQLGSQTTAPINESIRFKEFEGNCGLVWRVQDSNNYYRTVIETNGTLYLQKKIGGSISTITTASVSFSGGTFYWMRVIHDNANNVKITVWLDGNSEPSPQISVNDTSITSAGGYGIADVSYSGGGVSSYDSYTVTDNSSGNPPLNLIDSVTTVESLLLQPALITSEAAIATELAVLALAIIAVATSTSLDSVSLVAPIATVYATGYGRDGYAIGSSRDGVATGEGA